MYFKEIEAHQGEGAFAEAIAGMQSQGIPIPQILHLFAFKPNMTRHLAAFTQELMRGPSPLSAGMRELIAAFTSSSNQCPFWIGSHAAVAAELLGDQALVESVLKDFPTSQLTEAEKALFSFIDKVNRRSNQITQQDVDAVKHAGWSEEAIYDALTVCSLFNFYNRWTDATGVQDMPAAAYKISGKRMAAHGYLHEANVNRES